MKQYPDTEPSNGAPVAVALLVVGISLNTTGVVLVALRGMVWPGLLLMVAGIGILLFAVFQLTADARRGRTEEQAAAGTKGGRGPGDSNRDADSRAEHGGEARDG
jgi:hypothetical protein